MTALLVNSGRLYALADRNDAWHAHVDADLGFVDASLVAIAERLRIGSILTVDRTHFSLVRPRQCRSFRLYP